MIGLHLTSILVKNDAVYDEARLEIHSLSLSEIPMESDARDRCPRTLIPQPDICDKGQYLTFASTSSPQFGDSLDFALFLRIFFSLVRLFLSLLQKRVFYESQLWKLLARFKK